MSLNYALATNLTQGFLVNNNDDITTLIYFAPEALLLTVGIFSVI